MRARHPAGRASIHHLQNIRSLVRHLAEDAGLREADSFARSFQILMEGSIVSAAAGDFDAAHRARAIARSLIDQHRSHESAGGAS
jgi:hypothetical protein